MPQGGGSGQSIRVVGGAQYAEAGGSLTVQLANKPAVVRVVVAGAPATAKSYPVGPDGRLTIAVPNVPGSELVIRVRGVPPSAEKRLPIVNLF